MVKGEIQAEPEKDNQFYLEFCMPVCYHYRKQIEVGQKQ